MLAVIKEDVLFIFYKKVWAIRFKVRGDGYESNFLL